MEVSDKLQIPASYALGKGPSLAIEDEDGLVQGRKWNTIPRSFNPQPDH